MIHIGNSLAYLLTRYPKISIQNLGTFRSIWTRDYRWNVDFTPGADGHSSCLLEFIAKQSNISDQKATDSLNDLVYDINKKLESERQAEIGGFGKFLLKNGTCHFVSTGADFVEVAEPLISLEDVPSAEQSSSTKVEYQETITARSNWRFVLWGFLCLIVGYVGVRFVEPSLTQPFESKVWAVLDRHEAGNQVSSGSLLPDEVAVPEAVLPDPVATLTQDSSVEEDTIVQNTENVQEPALQSVNAGEFRYEIIVASFASLRQAEKYVDEMKGKGHQFTVMDSRMPGNRKKVSWGSYPSEEEANAVLRKVQKEFEAGAWVAKVPNPR